MTPTIIVGLISDTHGLLRPEALDALAGSDLIIHAGGIGNPAILNALRRLAPVTAIRGNIAKDAWAQSLPATEVVQVGGSTLLYILHDLAALDLDPVAAGFGAVISGHSHRPRFHWADGVLYINPGSAGPRRFSLPISVGRIIVSAAGLAPNMIPIKPRRT